MSNKPAGTQFCCGIPHPKPQCDDCPMKYWDKQDAQVFAKGILADAERIKDYKPSTPAVRLINLAKAYLEILRNYALVREVVQTKAQPQAKRSSIRQSR